MTRRRTRSRSPFGPLPGLILVAMVAGILVALAPVAGAASISNPAAINTTDPPCDPPGSVGPATLYPSNINVMGVTGVVSDVNVTLSGMNNWRGDFEILLASPGGARNLVLLSDAGTGDVSNFTLIFDDAAASVLPQNSAWGPSPLTAKPTNYTELSGAETSFPAPAPSPLNNPAPAGSATLASAFNGISPLGNWSLYVVGDACDDPVETITGGWTIDITTAVGAATTTSVVGTPNPSTTGQNVTFTATVTSGGSAVTTGSVTFTEGVTTLAANVAVSAAGQASFAKSDLAEGNHIITATYNGSAGFNTSNGSVDQRVNNPTTVTGSTYCNTGPIAVNAATAATPYPSHISVSGASTQISKVTATLKNVTHEFPDDIDVLLVGPTAQNMVLLSDAGLASGGTFGANNVTAIFDDAAAGQLAQATPWGAPGSTVSSKPVDYDPAAQVDAFPSPAPAPSAATALSVYNGTNSNGTWSLYVVSDGAPQTGTIAGGWCLDIAGITTVTVNATGSQAFGSSSPTFSTSTSPPAGHTFTGTLVCTTVDGPPVAISSSLAQGAHTINGSSCSGLGIAGPNPGAYQIAYSGGAFTVGPPPPQISIGDVSVAEGNAGSATLVFPLRRVGDLSAASSLTYTTFNDTAVAPGDYVAVTSPTTVTFAAAATTASISVTVNGDTLNESHERLLVDLANPTNANLIDTQAIGVITNDDGPGASLSVADVHVLEGNASNTAAQFVITRTGPLTETSSAKATFYNQTALGTSDYIGSGPVTVSFGPGETTRTVAFTVIGDTTDEANETFTLNLSNQLNATVADGVGTAVIVDDDGGPAVFPSAAILSVDDVSTLEGDTGQKDLVFMVTRSGDTSGTSTIKVSTAGSTANPTATAGVDYVAVPLTTLTFGPGDTAKLVTVKVNGDTAAEAHEQFLLNLTSVTGAVVADSVGAGNITNDDGAIPQLSVSDVLLAEGTGAPTSASFILTRTGDAGAQVKVTVSTANRTATAGSDYTALVPTEVTIAAGDTQVVVAVTVTADSADEPDETFVLRLTDAVGAVVVDDIGTATILDDDL